MMMLNYSRVRMIVNHQDLSTRCRFTSSKLKGVIASLLKIHPPLKESICIVCWNQKDMIRKSFTESLRLILLHQNKMELSS